MNDQYDPDRPLPAVSVLDVVTLSPLECYAVLTQLVVNADSQVSKAIRAALESILSRTRIEGR